MINTCCLQTHLTVHRVCGQTPVCEISCSEYKSLPGMFKSYIQHLIKIAAFMV